MYDKTYFTSRNYENYLRRKFDLLANDLVDELNLEPSDRVVDFGCGYGGLIQELHRTGFDSIWGTDISNWAIEYGRGVFPEIADRLHYYNRNLLSEPKRHVFFLDVLEHMPEYEVEFALQLARNGLEGYLVARIPISAQEGETYVLDVSNNDPTHINCHCRDWWLELFVKMGYDFVGDIKTLAIYSSDGVLSGKWMKR